MSVPSLASTDLAALYLLMCEAVPGGTLDNGVQSFTDDQVERAKRRIYNLARDGVLTRHGGEERGQARWDLREIHRLCFKTE